jgi:hypothetical protein
MSNTHYKKWWLYMPIGFLFVSAGILAIVYSLDKLPNNDWTVWATVSILAINLGLGFLGSALIHKIKSDLIRRERLKHRGPEQEEI